MANKFVEPIITKIVDVLTNGMPTKLDSIDSEFDDGITLEDIRRFYLGRKLLIPANHYPAIDVWPVDGDGEDYTTHTINTVYEVNVRVSVIGDTNFETLQKRTWRYLRAMTEVLMATRDLEKTVNYFSYAGHEYEALEEHDGGALGYSAIAKFNVSNEEVTRAISTSVINVDSAAYVASGNTADYDIEDCKSGVFFLNVSAIVGTLDLVVETKDFVSGEYYTIGTFTQMTATGAQHVYISAGLGEFIRLRYTVSNSATFSMQSVLNVDGGYTQEPNFVAEYIWNKVELTDNKSEQTFTTNSGALSLANLDSSQTVLPDFAGNVNVEVSTVYQDQKVFISTEPSISGGNVSVGITLSNFDSNVGTPYVNVIVRQL